MSFRFKGLPSEQFSNLAALTDAELEARGFRRMVADEKPGFPCRVSLEDAEPGERVLLVNYEHQPAHSPYRAKGPIFVRETARGSYNSTDVPPVLRPRLLSLRAYNEAGMIVEADVVDGLQVETLLTKLFAQQETAYVHIHYAKRGCYAALVERL
jgi:hypothetical protein